MSSPAIKKIFRPSVYRALLHKALAAAGIGGKVYVTNFVKHFKWELRGKLRLHKKPNTVEIKASPSLG